MRYRIAVNHVLHKPMTVDEFLGAVAVLSMPEIGVEPPLAELYEGVELAPPEPPKPE